jgi:hypothetical protein
MLVMYSVWRTYVSYILFFLFLYKSLFVMYFYYGYRSMAPRITTLHSHKILSPFIYYDRET